MKAIALGDTHGRKDWAKIIEKEQPDKIIFVGDYFDTREDISVEEQIINFKNILNLKKKNPQKVILLFGNHDYHYLRTTRENYSGYQEWSKTDIQEVLHPAIDAGLMQMCYVLDNKFLFSHAGVTKTWCKNNSINPDKDLEKQINELFIFKPNSFVFTTGKNMDMYGDDVEQSPIWVRPKSLLLDSIGIFIQVVGHTTQEEILCHNEAIFIDTLGTSGEYLIIEDGKVSSASTNSIL